MGAVHGEYSFRQTSRILATFPSLLELPSLVASCIPMGDPSEVRWSRWNANCRVMPKIDILSENFATKTNADGRFRLPPVIGKYKVWVTPGASSYDRVEPTFLTADARPPLIAPKLVVLDGTDMQRELDFQAGPLLTVRGTIRWPNGDPAAGVDVTVGTIMKGTTSGIDLGHTPQRQTVVDTRYGCLSRYATSM